jgi:predicted ester cyclase
MTNEELVRTACKVIWSDGDIFRIGEFYAEDFQADYPMTDWGKGLEGIKNLAILQREAFPDYREEIDELIDAGDRIIVVLTIRGTHKGPFGGMAATGKSFEIRDVTICTCRNGKIVGQCGVSDYLAAYLQLGVIDFPAVS